MGHRRDDVFVLGEEPLGAESPVDSAPEESPTEEVRNPFARVPRSVKGGGPSRLSGVRVSPRAIALAALGAVGMVLLAVVVSAMRGGGETPTVGVRRESRPAPNPGETAGAEVIDGADRAQARAQRARAAESRARRESLRARARRREQLSRRQRNEPKREPSEVQEAPVAYSADTPTYELAPPPESTPAPINPPPEPSAPPTGGGGSAGRPEFSFER